jgi:ribosomal protein S18 acetylase RimI-like enzyme
VVVADDWQRQGLATRMLSALAERAEREGIQTFTASVQGDNQPTLGLLRRFRPAERGTFCDGLVEMTLPVRPQDAAR